jgi:hypothetical protein
VTNVTRQAAASHDTVGFWSLAETSQEVSRQKSHAFLQGSVADVYRIQIGWFT